MPQCLKNENDYNQPWACMHSISEINYHHGTLILEQERLETPKKARDSVKKHYLPAVGRTTLKDTQPNIALKTSLLSDACAALRLFDFGMSPWYTCDTMDHIYSK